MQLLVFKVAYVIVDHMIEVIWWQLQEIAPHDVEILEQQRRVAFRLALPGSKAVRTGLIDLQDTLELFKLSALMVLIIFQIARKEPFRGQDLTLGTPRKENERDHHGPETH